MMAVPQPTRIFTNRVGAALAARESMRLRSDGRSRFHSADAINFRMAGAGITPAWRATSIPPLKSAIVGWP